MVILMMIMLFLSGLLIVFVRSVILARRGRESVRLQEKVVNDELEIAGLNENMQAVWERMIIENQFEDPRPEIMAMCEDERETIRHRIDTRVAEIAECRIKLTNTDNYDNAVWLVLLTAAILFVAWWGASVIFRPISYILGWISFTNNNTWKYEIYLNG